MHHSYAAEWQHGKARVRNLAGCLLRPPPQVKTIIEFLFENWSYRPLDFSPRLDFMQLHVSHWILFLYTNIVASFFSPPYYTCTSLPSPLPLPPHHHRLPQPHPFIQHHVLIINIHLLNSTVLTAFTLCPKRTTGPKTCLSNRHAIAATSSTCENFLPGQIRWLCTHGTK